MREDCSARTVWKQDCINVDWRWCSGSKYSCTGRFHSCLWRQLIVPLRSTLTKKTAAYHNSKEICQGLNGHVAFLKGIQTCWPSNSAKILAGKELLFVYKTFELFCKARELCDKSATRKHHKFRRNKLNRWPQYTYDSLSERDTICRTYHEHQQEFNTDYVCFYCSRNIFSTLSCVQRRAHVGGTLRSMVVQCVWNATGPSQDGFTPTSSLTGSRAWSSPL